MSPPSIDEELDSVFDPVQIDELEIPAWWVKDTKAKLKALIHQAEVVVRVDELQLSKEHCYSTDLVWKYLNDRINQLSDSQEETPDEPIEFPKGHKYHMEESDD